MYMVNLGRRLRHDRILIPVMLVVFALMICLRMPEIILKGRFWCEEGNIFYHNAWVLPPVKALFNSFGGYLNLSANAGTLAARWLLPVRLAPYLTITLALLVQLCPLLLLLSAQDSWLRPPFVRVCAGLLVLFVPAVEEIWLNSLHCQFQLTLCGGIILALGTDMFLGRAPVFRYLLLFFAPLCGPGAIALLPLYIARAILDRSPERLRQAFVLAIGSFIQVAFFMHHEHSRGYNLDPAVLLEVFTVRHLYLPFLGLDHTQIAAVAIKARSLSGHMPIKATLLPVLVFGPLLILTAKRRSLRPAFWFLIAGGVVACASYFGALGGAEGLIDSRAGGRYIFVPQALFSLSYLAVAANAGRWVSGAFWLVVAWLLLLGGFEFAQPWNFIADGPSWRYEVALWQHDPNHQPQEWYQGWSPVSLPAPR